MSGRYPFFTRFFIVQMLAGALAYIFILSQTMILYYTKPRVSNTFYGFFCKFFTIFSRSYLSLYSIPIIVNPCAGAVGPAVCLSAASNISSIASGFRFPAPTSISVPAMIRTIL